MPCSKLFFLIFKVKIVTTGWATNLTATLNNSQLLQKRKRVTLALACIISLRSLSHVPSYLKLK